MEVIMADLNLQHKINVPFAQNGDKDEIPDTSAEGLVNNTDGLGVKYETPIGQGGEYYTREIINGTLYKVYAAVKELQDLAISAGFPVDMTKAVNVLSLEHGGLGANTAAGGRNNLELGELAVLDTVDTNDIEDGAVTQAKLASSVVGNLPIGFIYFQLRGQSTPDVLFGTSGKWQDISSTYAGEFFRAVGGNSASFGSKQNEGLPTFNIVTDRAVQGQGKVLPKGEKLTSANKGLGGMASTQGYNGTSAVAIGTGNTSFSQSPFPYFVPNNSIYGASTHVTPYNSAIRIWKKIS